jgi:hypothetical protein
VIEGDRASSEGNLLERSAAMRHASICLLLVAGLLGGCAVNPEHRTLSAFGEVPPDGLTRLAADIEAHGEIDTALGLYRQAAEGTPDALAYVRLGEAYTRRSDRPGYRCIPLGLAP